MATKFLDDSSHSVFQIVQEEIHKQHVDVIVTAVRTGLEIANDKVCQKIRKTKQGEKELTAVYMEEDKIILTSGGKLKCTYVLHVALPKATSEQMFCGRLQECLEMAESLKATTIAFADFVETKDSTTALARCMARTFCSYAKSESVLKTIKVATTDEDMLRALWLARGKMIGIYATRLRTVGAQFFNRHHILTVTVGDIEKQEVDVIVISTTPTMLDNSTAGVITKAVIHGGGDKLIDEINKKHSKGLKTWEIARTSGGNLHCSNIYHTLLGAWTDDAIMQKHITELVLNTLTYAAQSNLDTIAFHVLGSGIMSFPVKDVASYMIQAFDQFFENQPNSSIVEMRIVLHKTQTSMQEIFEHVAIITETKPQHQDSRPLSGVLKTLQPDEVRLIKLESTNIEFKHMAHSFLMKVPKSTIIQIEKIGNSKLFGAYMRMQDKIKDSNSHLNLIQTSLWYRASKRDVENINQHGFTKVESGTQGTGLYFFTDPKEHIRNIKPDCDGKLYIYQCTVLIGDFASGSDSMSIPPSKSIEKSHLVFDSVTDDVVKSTMFVVFNKDQVYPKYLITYTIEDS